MGTFIGYVIFGAICFVAGFLVAANNRRLADKAKAEASAARDRLLDEIDREA
jgi:hypothetical protein